MATDTSLLPDRDDLLDEIVGEARIHARTGEVASYIPALARVPDDHLGVALVDVEGHERVAGDADIAFSVQSITKVFTLTLAMQRCGDLVWERVGREPSGDPFNSLVQLERERGRPRNPFINSGAIVVADLLHDACDDPRGELLELVSDLAGEPVEVDDEVWASEREHGARNRAMANLIAAFGNLHNEVEDVLDDYFHQSAVMMSARQLARSVRFLANDGVDPASGRQVLSDLDARRVTALMLTCGTYDAAGAFAFEVGIPCKSGVGGGIVGVVPDRLGVCAWSPPLDETGNSAAGRIALDLLVERSDLSIF